MIYILTFLLAFLLSIGLSPATIKISERFNILSLPGKGQERGKPCLGGIGIFLAFGVSVLCANFFDTYYPYRVMAGLLPSFLIIILGLIDDVKNLKPYEKIIVQLAAVIFLVSLGIFTRISFFPKWLNIVITFIWVIFITNAFNMLDIVDGLTSGLVVIISLTLFTICIVNKDIFSSLVLAALTGAHLGFLMHNYPPAKLYMGDTGSLFSGFLLATIAININYAPLEKPVALVTPILAMSLPIYDTFFLIIMRLKRRRPIFSKTNDHFALRLVTMGYSVRKSLWIMYLFSIFVAIGSLVVVFGSHIAGIISIFTVALIFIFAGKRVGLVKIED